MATKKNTTKKKEEVTTPAVTTEKVPGTQWVVDKLKELDGWNLNHREQFNQVGSALEGHGKTLVLISKAVDDQANLNSQIISLVGRLMRGLVGLTWLTFGLTVLNVIAWVVLVLYLARK